MNFQEQISKLYFLVALFFFGTVGLIAFFLAQTYIDDANLRSILSVAFLDTFLVGYCTCGFVMLSDLLMRLFGWGRDFWEKHKTISLAFPVLVFFVIISYALYVIVGITAAAVTVGTVLLGGTLGILGWLFKPHIEAMKKDNPPKSGPPSPP
ncbi:MAG: hypothetical protein AB1324_06465 [Candidatus Micrarchaeota archaeon]